MNTRVLDEAQALCMAQRRAKAITPPSCCSYGATKGKTIASPCWACIESASEIQARSAGQLERD